MIRLETLVRDGTKFILRSIYLNPAFVVTIREHEILTKDLRDGKKRFPEGLSAEHTLSEIIYSEGSNSKSLLAIGSPEIIQLKLFSNSTKMLLRG